jgi:uncharacterized protein YehS (DUF1456 family)
MPFIFAMFIGLLLSGCGTDLSNISEKAISQSKPKTTKKPSIEGNYTLKEGRYSYNSNNAIAKLVNSSDLVIEKLDDDDYGYYFTMQVENLTPTEEYGIFHKKDNKFFKRIIYSTNITKDSNISIDSNISDEHLKTEITNKVEIIVTEDTIKISMKIRDGKMVMIWSRDKDSTKEITKGMRRAEHEYFKTYKERFLKFFKDI